jgi:hypothetical protein
MCRVCAWCGRFMGVRPSLTDPDVTHGICAECAEQVQREHRGSRGRIVIVIRRSQRELRDRLEAQTAGLPGVTVRMDERAGDRRQDGGYRGRNRRHVSRRRALRLSQLAAWRTLGCFVAQGPP